MRIIKKIIAFYRILNMLHTAQKNIDEISKAYGCTIDPKVLISINDVKNFRIGKKSSIGAYTVINISEFDPKKNNSNSILEIGSNTYIGELNNIRAAGGRIKIGDNCLISQNISIVAANHSFDAGTLINEQPWSLGNINITIGNDVWIGCGSIILPGVIIGDGCIIGAGSVVNKSLPDNCIAVGIPAKIIRIRS
jgi:acetyltransferase-like isoleucine patch superfamily enzyme